LRTFAHKSAQKHRLFVKYSSSQTVARQVGAGGRTVDSNRGVRIPLPPHLVIFS